MTVKHDFYKLSLLISGLIILCLLYENYQLNIENKSVKYQYQIGLKKAVKEVTSKVDTFTRFVTQTVFKYQGDSLIKISPPTQNAIKLPIYKTTDSIAELQAKTLFKDRQIEKYKKDSIKSIYTLIAANHKTDSVIKGNQNLTFIVANLDGRLSELDSINASKSINKIIAEPVKIRRSKFLFSKQDDFLKLQKIGGDTASINGKDYLLYPTENKYTNQLLFQLRSSYNYGTDKFSFGPGVELKFGGKGINVAYLGDPTNGNAFVHKAALVFGLRFDILHTTFKSSKFQNSNFNGSGSASAFGYNPYQAQ